jgi:hypothetical protein
LDTGVHKVQVVAALHPLKFDTVELLVDGGQTVAQIMGREDVSALVWADGELIECEHWTTVVPERHLVIKRLPADGDSLRIVAFIALAVFAPYAASAMGFVGATGALTLTGSLVAVGIGIVGSLAINALIPPSTPNISGTGGQQSLNSITGQSNQVAPWAPIAKVYGTPTYYPTIPMTGLPYTELVGEDQYIRLLLVLGYGPLSIGGVTAGAGNALITQATSLTGNPIKIGGTSIDQFEDVEFQIGDPDDVTLFTNAVVENAVNVAINAVSEPTSDDQLVVDNEVRTQTTEPDTDEVSLDLFFPALFAVSSNGNTRRIRVNFEVHSSPAGADTWTLRSSLSVLSNERKPIRRGVRFVMPAPGQYDIRLTRVSTFYQRKNTFFRDCTWTVLRSIKRNVRAFDVDNTVVMALRIRATDQLGGRIDRLSVSASGIIPVWNGSAWAPAITRNPAWVYADIISGIATKSAQAKSKLDTTALAAWATWTAANGVYFDGVIDAEGTVFDRAREVAATGFGSWHVTDEAKFSVVRDVATTPKMIVTPRNSAGFSSNYAFNHLPHALRVQFIDPDIWEPTERIVYDDGYTSSTATRYEQIQTVGITDPDHAWKFGRYHLAQFRLRPESYSWGQDVQHLAYQRGDTVEVANDVILVGISWGRIKSITVDGSGDALTATVDELLEMEAAKDYAFKIHRSDGTIATAGIATVLGGTRTVTFDSPVVDIAAGDHFAFGEAGVETILAKVTRIEPQGDFKARITAVPAADNIFDGWTGTIPAFDPVITEPVNPDLLPPQIPTLISVTSDNVLPFESTGSLRLRLAIVFTMPPGLTGVSVEAHYRSIETLDSVESVTAWTMIPGVDSPVGLLFVDEVEEGIVYQVQIRSRKGERVSSWTDIASHTIPGQNQRLVQPSVFYNRQNLWRKSSAGDWTPSETTVDGTATFKTFAGTVATRVIRATLDTATGFITVAAQSNEGDATSFSTSGAGSGSVATTVTHDDSGVTAVLNFASVASGEDGSSVLILGTLALVSDLDDIVSPDPGDGYIIDGDLWVWDGSAWQNVGQIQGPQGASGVSARGVSLSVGSQAFTYNVAGTTPSPASTTVTATAVNTTGTVYYQFLKDGSSVQNTTASTYTYTPPASHTNTPERIEVRIREGSDAGDILASDTLSIVFIRAGLDAITVALSNEAHVLPADAAGTVTSYAGSGTTIRAWIGSTALNYAASGASTFSVSTSVSNITAGAASGTGDTRTYANASAMTADLASITFTIAVRNAANVSTSITKIQSFSKSKVGATGATGPTGPQGNQGVAGADGPDGADGADAISVTVTNEAYAIPAYSSGTVISFADAFGQLTVWDGASDVTGSAELSAVAVGCTGTINTATDTPVSEQPKGYYRVTAMSADTATLTLQAIYGGVTLTKVFSLTKSLRGYEIVGTLPVADLFAGRMVFLTTDNKLYRYTGSAWTAAVPATDVTGQLTDAQLQAIAAAKVTGTISSDQIANGSVSGTKFASGLTPVEIFASLPDTGNFEGRVVFLTTDDKLYRYTGSAWTAAIPTTDLTGTISTAQIAASAIDVSKFASGIRPVEILAALPGSGNFAGRLVFLTSDNKLYRHTGSDWTAAVPSTDISGQLADAQIAALAASKVTGQLTDAQIQAIAAAKVSGQLTDAQIQAISAAKVSGTLTDAQIASLATSKLTGTITNTQIADDAITAPKIFAGSITTNKLAANSVTADQIAANSIVSGKIAAGSVSTTELAALSVTAEKIGAAAVTTAKLSAGAVVADTISANAVTAVKIQAGAVESAKIAAGAIDAGKISAGAVTADKISANAVTTDKISANAVTAGKVAAGAIGADQILANSILASKLVVSDQTNIYPDFDCEDVGFYSSDGTISFLATTGATVGRRFLNLLADAAEKTVLTGWFPIERLAPHAVSGTVFGSGTDSTQTLLIEFGSLSTSGGLPVVTTLRQEIVGTRVNSTSTAVFSLDVTTASTEKRARFVMVRAAGGASSARMGGLRVTRRMNAQLIVDGAITADKITTNAVTADKISANAVTAAKIASNSITTDKLDANSVTAAKVAAGAITATELAASAVTADKIAANAVTAVKIAAGSIETAKLAAGAVTADTIAANAITTPKIQAGAIDANKLAANSVTADAIAAGQITAAKLATTELITLSAQIKDGIITNAKIGSLDAGKITAGDISVGLGVSGSGRIYSGKTTYATAADGWFLGMDGGVPKFKIGNSDGSAQLAWDGTSLSVQGQIIDWSNNVVGASKPSDNANQTRTVSDYQTSPVLITSFEVWQEIIGANIDTGGQRVFVMFSALGGPNNAPVDVEVRRGATVLASFTHYVTGVNTMLSFNVGEASPPSGSNNFGIYMKKPSSGSNSSAWSRRSIMLLGSL